MLLSVPVNAGGALDMGAVAALFVKSVIPQATSFLANNLNANGVPLEEDGDLQTQTLEIMLMHGFPQVADQIITTGESLLAPPGSGHRTCAECCRTVLEQALTVGPVCACNRCVPAPRPGATLPFTSHFAWLPPTAIP